MDKADSTHGEKRNAYTTLIGQTKANRLHGRLGSRWGSGIKVDLRKQFRILWTGFIFILGMDAWRACVNAILSVCVAQKVGSLFTN